MARAIDECRGPAAVVFAGDVFDLRDGTDVDSALIAHPRLSAALATFVAADDHRLVVLPGIRDSALAHDQRSIDAVTGFGGEVALACVLEVDTGVGCRLVHVEPGHRLDPSAAYTDPRDPNDRPLAQHLMREIGPGIAGAKGSSAWLAGIDELVDRGQAGAFVASRLAYRRLLRRSGWLVVPALVGLALFWSFFELTGRRMNGSAVSRVFRLLGAGLTLELAVVAVVLVFTVTQLHDALGGVAWWGSHPRGNDDARGEAVTLASAGGVGLVTALHAPPGADRSRWRIVLRELRERRPGGRAGRGARRLPAGVRRAAPMLVGRARGGRGAARPALARRTRSPDLHVDGAGRRASSGSGRRGRPRSSRGIRAPSRGRRPVTRPRSGGGPGGSRRPRSRSPE